MKRHPFQPTWQPLAIMIAAAISSLILGLQNNGALATPAVNLVEREYQLPPLETKRCLPSFTLSSTSISTLLSSSKEWKKPISPSKLAFIPTSRTLHRTNKAIESTKIKPHWPQLNLSQSPFQQTQAPDQLADDDLVALPFDSYLASITKGGTTDASSPESNEGEKTPTPPTQPLRLCVVRDQELVFPLIRHEDDVETDLFLDPRFVEKSIRLSEVLQLATKSNEGTGMGNMGNAGNVGNMGNPIPYYGVGWYGQRPVPSLGGGPGYGADATEVWSMEEEVLERLMEEGVEVPTMDVGIAHGEKARGGALF